MPSPKRKEPVLEMLSVLVEAFFEGDKCKGASVVNPYLSHEKIRSLSYVLLMLSVALHDKEKLEVKQVECDELIGRITYGRIE